jgi:hypothetical protein
MAVKGTPCICWEHRAGAPREIGEHRYVLEESDRTFSDGVPWPQWRATCPCGRGRATQWQSQSDSVAYHAWLRHVEKYS